MGNIFSVLRFGWAYLRRYRTRLFVGLLFSVLFALSNASFVWATRTIIDRFDTKPARIEESAPAKPGLTSAIALRFKEINASAQEFMEPWLPRKGEQLSTRHIVGLLLFFPLLVAFRGITDYLSNSVRPVSSSRSRSCWAR